MTDSKNSFTRRFSLLMILVLSWISCGLTPSIVLAADDSAAAPTELKLYPHLFSYVPRGGSKHQVVVAGVFNGWCQEATPMTRQKDGVYSVSVRLSEGVHLYKFLVDRQWTNDPHSDPELEVS